MSSAPVSVVLAVRNGADFIAEALASVCDSDCPPHEVLVVDGASTDATRSIASRFASPFARVRVVPQEGRGISAAYNQGVAEASAPLVAFISHDDQWLPGKLAAQVAHLESTPETDAVVGHVQHFLTDGATVPPGFRAELLERAVPGYVMETLLVRRTLLDRIGPFDTSMATAADVDWYARAKDAGARIDLLPQTVLRKRVHGSNASITAPRNNAELLAALRSSLTRKRALTVPQGTSA